MTWLAQNQSLHGSVSHQAKTESAYGTGSLVKEQMCHYSQLFPRELSDLWYKQNHHSIVLAQSQSWMHNYSLVVSFACKNSLVLDSYGFICAGDEISPLSSEVW